MAIVNRRSYIYNGQWGGQHNQLNYWFISDYYFPNNFQMAEWNICAVLGVYSITGPVLNITYGNHPRAFASDSKLLSYINSALSSGNAAPNGAGWKRYVYVRNFD